MELELELELELEPELELEVEIADGLNILLMRCYPLVGGRGINMATSPLPSRRPHGGERSIWPHHPCLLGVPMVGINQPRREWMWWK